MNGQININYKKYTKYINKNISLGGKLPILKDDNHKLCHDDKIIDQEREYVINNCIPLYNTKNIDLNIIIKKNNTDYFFHYNNENSSNYLLNINDLSLSKYDKKVEYNKIEKNKLNRKYLKQYLNFLYVKNDLETVNIPYYFILLDHEQIFNIYLNLVNKNLDKNPYFRTLSKVNDSTIMHKFVGMSLSFNIFNLSLFTHTYFDAIELFLFVLSWGKDIKKNSGTIKKRIQEKLIYLYKDIDLELIHDLSIYKKKINILSLNDRDAFGKTKFRSENEKYKDIINLENDNTISSNKNIIIQSLSDSIVNLSIELYDISEKINMNDFKYIFLLSFLNYRLNNPYIKGGWKFSEEYIYSQINERITKENIKSKNDMSNLYIKSNLPPIYEYSITKDGCGDCMENTIFQFLKIMFWDYENSKYKLDLIEKTIDSKYLEIIMHFFTDIMNERKKEQINKRFDFFDSLSPDLDFLNKNKNIELNTTLKNFIMIFSILFNEPFDLSDIAKSSSEEFLNKIISKENISEYDRFIYDFDININEREQLIYINTNIGNRLKVILSNNSHAFFEDSKMDHSLLNVINYIETKKLEDDIKFLSKEIQEQRDVSYSEFYIHTLLINLLNNNKNKEFEKLIKFIYYENTNKITSVFFILNNDSLSVKLREKIFNLLIKESVIFKNTYMNYNDIYDMIIKFKDNIKKNISELLKYQFINKNLFFLINLERKNIYEILNELKNIELEARDLDKNTILHLAAKYGYIDIGEYYINNSDNANINNLNYLNQNALHLVAQNGNVLFAKMLIVNNINMNAMDKNRKFPINYAAENSNTELVNLLLENKVDIDTSLASREYTSKRSALNSAIISDNIELVKIFIDYYNKNKSDDNDKRTTYIYAFSKAIEYNKIKLVSYFIDTDIKNIINITSENKTNRDYLQHFLENAVNNNNNIIFDLLIKNNIGTNTSDINKVLNNNLTKDNILIFQKLIDKLGVNYRDDSNNNFFHFASKYGFLSIVKKIIHLFDINEKNKDGNTALHYASINGNSDIVKYLIINNADVLIKNIINDSTAYEEAFLNYHYDVIKILVSRTKNINPTNKTGKKLIFRLIEIYIGENLEDFDENGVYEYMNADNNVEKKNDIIKKYKKVNFKKIFKFIINYGINVNEQDEYKNSILHYFSQLNDLDMIKFLLDRNANVNILNNNNNTPIFWAVQKNNFEITKVLIDSGADIYIKDINGNTLLHEAAKIKNGDNLISLFIKKINVNMKNKNNDTPLHLLFDKSDLIKKIKFFLKNGADINTINNDGNTPLHILTKSYERYHNNNKEVIFLLINNNKKVNINIKNNEGKTPIHYIIEKCNIELLEFIIKNIQNLDEIIKIKNNKKTILHIATQFECVNIIDVLLNYNMIQNYINLQDSKGNTALHYATIKFNEHYYSFEKKIIITENILNNQYVDINIQNIDGNTPLHLSLIYKIEDITEKLLNNTKYICDVNMQNNDGNTPLHMVIINKQIKFINPILKNKISPKIEIQNNDGDTPLHLSYKDKNIDITKEILDFNNNPNIINKNGDTILHLALKDDNNAFINLIINYSPNLNIKNKYGETPYQLVKQLNKYNRILNID
jgi:ankyrin repeat protein